jgi:hypothetical protein
VVARNLHPANPHVNYFICLGGETESLMPFGGAHAPCIPVNLKFEIGRFGLIVRVGGPLDTSFSDTTSVGGACIHQPSRQDQIDGVQISDLQPRVLPEPHPAHAPCTASKLKTWRHVDFWCSAAASAPLRYRMVDYGGCPEIRGYCDQIRPQT